MEGVSNWKGKVNFEGQPMEKKGRIISQEAKEGIKEPSTINPQKGGNLIGFWV